MSTDRETRERDDWRYAFAVVEEAAEDSSLYNDTVYAALREIENRLAPSPESETETGEPDTRRPLAPGAIKKAETEARRAVARAVDLQGPDPLARSNSLPNARTRDDREVRDPGEQEGDEELRDLMLGRAAIIDNSVEKAGTYAIQTTGQPNSTQWLLRQAAARLRRTEEERNEHRLLVEEIEQHVGRALDMSGDLTVYDDVKAALDGLTSLRRALSPTDGGES